MSGMAIMTVIHELVHVEQWDEVTDKTQHGRKFQKRMKQLAARGAFSGLW
jgi:predicted SprT family Zn-dependent metalloprotease